MDERLTLVADERVAQQVDSLANEYGLSRQEVLRQLIAAGLDVVGD